LQATEKKKITKDKTESLDVDYVAWFGRVEDVRVLEAERRVNAE
jgi:hypothetical protein